MSINQDIDIFIQNDMNIRIDISDIVRLIRVSSKIGEGRISQEKLAEISDLSSKTIGRIENKITRPSLTALTNIIESLDLRLVILDSHNYSKLEDKSVL